MSNTLSITVLAGLGLNAAFGWWWAEPTVALVVTALAAHSGHQAWRGAIEASTTGNEEITASRTDHA